MHNSCITQMLQMVDGLKPLPSPPLILPSFFSLLSFCAVRGTLATRELQVKCLMIIKCRRQLSWLYVERKECCSSWTKAKMPQEICLRKPKYVQSLQYIHKWLAQFTYFSLKYLKYSLNFDLPNLNEFSHFRQLSWNWNMSNCSPNRIVAHLASAARHAIPKALGAELIMQ